jgi:hypothetical protein
MLILLPRDVRKRIFKTFLIEDFFHLPPVQWCTLSCEYLRENQQIRNGFNGILRGLGETDS